jgi:hypothetical protein
MKVYRTKRYQRDIKHLRMTVSEIAELERAVTENPWLGSVIPGMHGIRKVRFALGNKGKRGGGRAIYFVQIAEDAVVMMFAYSKAAQEDLDEDDKRFALAIMESWKNA